MTVTQLPVTHAPANNRVERASGFVLSKQKPACRCLRCGGNLYLEPDLAGEVLVMKCLLCSREQCLTTAEELIADYGVSARAAFRATRQPISTIWATREDAA